MTPAQDDALKKITELVREHFEAGVITVLGEDERELQWHGGTYVAIGLLEAAKDRLLGHVRLPGNEDDDL